MGAGCYDEQIKKYDSLCWRKIFTAINVLCYGCDRNAGNVSDCHTADCNEV